MVSVELSKADASSCVRPSKRAPMSWTPSGTFSSPDAAVCAELYYTLETVRRHALHILWCSLCVFLCLIRSWPWPWMGIPCLMLISPTTLWGLSKTNALGSSLLINWLVTSPNIPMTFETKLPLNVQKTLTQGFVGSNQIFYIVNITFHLTRLRSILFFQFKPFGIASRAKFQREWCYPMDLHTLLWL